jgi:polar amino acid transport system substrate-binding protein
MSGGGDRWKACPNRRARYDWTPVFYLVMGKASSRAILFGATSVALSVLAGSAPASAGPQTVATPSFWDPALRIERPPLPGLRAIRFLTDDSYPPLNFALADGALAGFNVDIARAICEQLEIGCTIQARRWNTLIDALESGKGDAVIASIAADGAIRARVDFSQPYYQTPARFVVRKGLALSDVSPSVLKGTTVGVVSGSAHEAYLTAFFPGVALKAFASVSALQEALRSATVEAAFGDGLTFAVWLNGESSGDCCAFLGGPYCESRFFGEGVAIAVRKEDGDLRHAMDWALARLVSRGVYAEIYLKYFPIGFYQ